MRVLITAGPTREPIDPVRYLSNRSSGKMGYALAEAAQAAGWDVVLISGPVALTPPDGVQYIPVETADEMYEAVMQHIPHVDMAILAAAVSDFKPANVAPQKLKKRDGIPEIRLIPNRDILASLGKITPRKFRLIGFAAETQAIAQNAMEKLAKKNCDCIIANDVSQKGQGFESDYNAVTLYTKNQDPIVLPKNTKKEISAEILKICAAL